MHAEQGVRETWCFFLVGDNRGPSFLPLLLLGLMPLEPSSRTDSSLTRLLLGPRVLSLFHDVER